MAKHTQLTHFLLESLSKTGYFIVSRLSVTVALILVLKIRGSTVVMAIFLAMVSFFLGISDMLQKKKEAIIKDIRLHIGFITTE